MYELIECAPIYKIDLDVGGVAINKHNLIIINYLIKVVLKSETDGAVTCWYNEFHAEIVWYKGVKVSICTSIRFINYTEVIRSKTIISTRTEISEEK